MDYDVIVIGGGSAGYAAADTAQRAGAQVAIVDPGPLGGLCILRGCMPTKTILRSSDILALMHRAPEFGLAVDNPRADLAAIIERKDRLIAEFTNYRVEQLKNPRFTLIEDAAHFVSANAIEAGGKRYSARAFVIATGSVIADVPIPGLDATGFLTSDDTLELRQQPDSMIVLGAGFVGVELAQFYQRIGTQVTLVQRSGHILSSHDEDLARPLEARLREEGMTVYTGTRDLKVSVQDGKRCAHFIHEGKEITVAAATLLNALGRTPNVAGLNLDAAGVKLGKWGIAVDDTLRTSKHNIFAVGDVTGLFEVVHIAIQHGEIAAYNALHPDGAQQRCEERLKTSVVFSDPAVASVGYSEKECRQNNWPYLAASYPFDDHGKSLCLGETHGHVKLLCRPDDGTLIGAHITGPEAGELIHHLIAVMYYHGTVYDLLKMPFYHPTLSEILTYPAEELAAKIG
ncbi:dihydrolipoyl dehydrogenase family protein [Nitrospina watsonii]|uniref:Dihydrolipoamide dehydrogenase E3 component of pyruvate/2-oxoglutarate dehydrogenase complex n=1 Tax=Nitrospina watsonii TaxID=1323948 RepID=A0ABN8VZ26_9BACT|nr:FAD-dependent oxidoreductase [Nitrospina watsonii]CAI2717433.1 putative dihydrolipoamide dehydrogenase E3 component of pyruvate/2-oxoglutarate dehydrogenase complex [Nitrospina watsonii]